MCRRFRTAGRFEFTMHTVTFLLVSLVAVSSAFLVPPAIPEDLKDLRFRGGPPKYVKDFFHALLEGQTTTIDLSCRDCPFASHIDDETPIWLNGIANTIHLEFTTSGHSLHLNGHPLLPLEEAQKAQSTTIKAYQVRKDTGEESAEMSLNFAMEIMPPMPSPHRDDVSMIPVEFTVLGLNGVPVKVNTISLKLIQTPNKELVIVRHDEIAFEQTPGADTCEGTRPWSLCRLKAIIMARMKTLTDTTKETAGDFQGWMKQKCGGRGPHGMESDHGRHHRHHHGPHRYRRLGHMLHQTFRFFVIPALLGVIGGLTASAIGMMVGQIIVFLWFRTYRRGQRGPLRSVERQLSVDVTEKEVLLVEEVLPEYEDAPLYETVVSSDHDADSGAHETEKY